MGREIRRVHLDYEHPRDESGDFIPLFECRLWEIDRTVVFGSWEEYVAARNKKYPEEASTYDRSIYMPTWQESERIGWCVYENVSEGTPWSPVFSSPEHVVAWLVIEHGYSDKAAALFVKTGSAVSFALMDGNLTDGITAIGEM